jgi:hypothetical protein
MRHPALLLLLSLLNTAALAAGPGQVGGPGVPMGSGGAAASPCPPDWTLHGKIQRNGCFSCGPVKGSAANAPELALACPANTHYFVDNRRLGCAANTKGPHKTRSKAPAKTHRPHTTAQGKTS